MYTGSLRTVPSHDSVTAVTSLITVSILSSALFYIVGFVCGCCHKYKRSVRENTANKTSHPPLSHPSTLLYEEVLPKSVEDQEQDLGIQGNVAYSPVCLKAT